MAFRLPDRIAIFFDGSNLFYALREFNDRNRMSIKINYAKLVEKLATGRPLLRAYYYCSHKVPIDPGVAKFHESLQYSGIQVVAKPLQSRTDMVTGQSYFVEKGIDVALVTDLLCLTWENAFDTAVLVSGDADFSQTVDRVKYKGKRIEIAAFRGSFSAELRRIADRIIFLDDLIEEISLVSPLHDTAR
ncbi:MAG: NYN domain-containing protein [Euryarchaeota archaeon]|nr:NYN domain-containing protein [Euryarchaeota archaeon]